MGGATWFLKVFYELKTRNYHVRRTIFCIKKMVFLIILVCVLHPRGVIFVHRLCKLRMRLVQVQAHCLRSLAILDSTIAPRPRTENSWISRGPPCPHQRLPWIKSTLKIARFVLTLGDSGFLQFVRVVSSDDKANPGESQHCSRMLTWIYPPHTPGCCLITQTTALFASIASWGGGWIQMIYIKNLVDL